MSDTYGTLYAAIQTKQLISAMYQGLIREMAPHALGTKNGKPQCLFFQFAGESKTGLPPGGMWRCIPLDGLQIANVYAGPWHTGTDHSRPQTCVGEIAIEVAF
jgi:hypothetical protein